MAYPGVPFTDQTIPSNYKKAHPAIPNAMDCQRLISKYGDIIEAVNNNVITEDFYTKAIEINTDRSKTHFQGIIRHPSSNVIYLSGSDKSNETAQLFVISISDFLTGTGSKKSKLSKGPMGTNVLGKEERPADQKDKLEAIYKISTKYWHAGGMDTEGDILAIPLENAEKKISKISFFCIKDPLKPIPFKGADIFREGAIAGAAALVRLKNGKYLCGVWIDSDAKKHRLDLYVSKTDNIEDGFEHELKRPHHSIPWKDKTVWLGNRRQRNFQNFQFYKDTSGLITCWAVNNKFITTPALKGLNNIHLLKLLLDEDALDGDNPKFQNVEVHQIKELPLNNTNLLYNLNAGGSFYITPEKKLALYAVAHWRNDKDCISMAEFYPPLDNTAGPITDIADVRIELYEDKKYGINPDGYMMKRILKIIGKNHNVVDDFNEIRVHARKFGDKVNSVKCIIPKGFSLWLYADDNMKGRKFEIKGTGKYEEVVDLGKVTKVGGKVSSMELKQN